MIVGAKLILFSLIGKNYWENCSAHPEPLLVDLYE